MNPLYTTNVRQVGTTSFLSVEVFRGNISAKGVEKVVPLIIKYDIEGNFTLQNHTHVLAGIIKHPYKPNSPAFNAERLADVEVSSFYKVLENFPNLIVDEVTQEPHALAEYIWSRMVYLLPDESVQEQLDKLGFLAKGQAHAQILSKLSDKFFETMGKKLDFYSVPKRKIGTFCWLSDDSGLGYIPKLFGFGIANAFPRDRLAREVNSLKAAERFQNPLPVEGIPENLAPYFTKVKVAILATKTSMMDGGDILSSGARKLSSILQRTKKVGNLEEVENRNIAFDVFKAGLVAYHKEIKKYDENVINPGPIRLIFPGGVKVAAQVYTDEQAFAPDGSEIDVMLDFRTFADKGSIGSFCLQQGLQPNSIEEAIEMFKNIKPEEVYFNGQIYPAYVGELPVMRPGQRYTDLCKPSRITFDSISYALTGKKYKVPAYLEEEYSKFVELIRAINKEIQS